MIPAVVPVQMLATAKSRLRPALGDATEPLVLAMLGDVLGALLAVPALGSVAVVTPDERVGAAALEAGAEALVRPDPGLNAALGAATHALARQARSGLLIVQGDVPGAAAEEIAALLASAPERGVVLAPSRDGGTSALLRVPADVIPPGFGRESAKVHRELASRAGVSFQEVALASLAIDIDERDDLDALVESDAAAPRTRALLREIGWGKPGRGDA